MIFRHLLNMRSHPTWVRGLKLFYTSHSLTKVLSHPTWVRGLKLQRKKQKLNKSESHPTWVRGLKLICAHYAAAQIGRTLRGCVD